MAAYANEPLQSDTLIVTMLKTLGAVFYIKTNVPTAMMMVSVALLDRGPELTDLDGN